MSPLSLVLLAGCQRDPECAAGEVLDAGRCVPEACGTEPWGNLDVDGDTFTVEAGASIQAAADAAGDADGGLVAIAAGTFVENLELGRVHDDVTIAGRCEELVVLDGSGGEEDDATLRAEGAAGVMLRGLTLTGGRHGGLWVSEATVRAESLRIRENAVVGVVAVGEGAALDLEDVDVIGTVPDWGGDLGYGIDVEEGAELSATSCLIQGNTGLGIYASGAGTSLTVTDTVVADTALDADGVWGWGVGVLSGASFAASSSTVERNHDAGIFAYGDGTRVALTDTVVTETESDASGAGACGICVESGAALQGVSSGIERNRGAGLLVTGEGASAGLFRTVVADTMPNVDGSFGRGIVVQDGAQLSAASSSVDGNREVGVYAYGAGTRVALTDSLVADTDLDGLGDLGLGIYVLDGASLAAEGCVVESNRGAGVFAMGEGAAVSLVDTRVSDTRSLADGTEGGGIGAMDAAVVLAESCTVERNHATGAYAVGEGATVYLVDTVISDTEANADGTRGNGIIAKEGATFIAESCTIARNHQAGVYASDPGTTVRLTDTHVTDTETDADGTGGWGLDVEAGAALSAASCLVARNRGIGVYAGGAGTTLSLVDTVVSDTEAAASPGLGVGVVDGASATLESCTVERNLGAGVLASGAGVVVSVVGCVVSDTEAATVDFGGRGIEVNRGAALAAASCTVARNEGLGVRASGLGSFVSLVDTSVLDTRRSPFTTFGVGAAAELGGTLDGTALTVTDTDGPGLYLASGSATCSECTLDGNAFAGALVTHGGTLGLYSSAISGTTADDNEGGGVGIYAGGSGGGEDSPPTLLLADTTISAHDYAAVWLDGPGAYVLSGNVLEGGPGFAPWTGAWWHGDGLYATGTTAWDEASATGVRLEANTFHDARSGLFLHGAGASLDANAWADNGTDLWQQRCDLEAPAGDAGVTTEVLCPDAERLVATLDFTGLYLEESTLADE